MSVNAQAEKLSPQHKSAGSKRLPGLARRISRGVGVDLHQGSKEDHHHQHQDCIKLILEINSSVASFRDLLIHVGQAKDCAELRDKIRKVRRQCVDVCKATNQIVLPQVRRDVAEGIPVDSQDLVHLFCLAQLLIRELKKCRRLVGAVPMDMTDYLLNRPGPSGMSVLGQIIMFQFAPDFTQEELTNIDRDTEEVGHLVAEMQEFMPKEENGKNLAFQEETFTRWQRRRRKHSIKWQRLLKSNCR